MECALNLSLFVIQLSRLLFTFRERGGSNEWCSGVTTWLLPLRVILQVNGLNESGK